MIIADNDLYYFFTMSLNKYPLISVCILNHNWENRLPKSIPSIISQDYPNLEILLLDNWSTDNSIEYIKQFKELKIIPNKSNLWTSWWRNKLANYAKWEYIFFIDNDLELTTKSFILDMIKAYINLEKQKIWVLIPIFKMINDDTHCEAWLYYNKIKKTKFEDAYKKWCIKVPGFAATGFLIKKEIFFNLWCFDEKYPYNMDDNDFSMRLYIMWYTIFVNTNLYAIHHGIETRTTAKGIWRRHQYYFCGLMRVRQWSADIKTLMLNVMLIMLAKTA